MIFDIVEKRNHFLSHASFATWEDAERFLVSVIPRYVTRNLYCLREGLRAEDFEIIEVAP